jgi:hypothetical protein
LHFQTRQPQSWQRIDRSQKARKSTIRAGASGSGFTRRLRAIPWPANRTMGIGYSGKMLDFRNGVKSEAARQPHAEFLPDMVIAYMISRVLNPGGLRPVYRLYTDRLRTHIQVFHSTLAIWQSTKRLFLRPREH